MKVVRYQAHHVMGVKEIDWQLEGHHLFLVGGRNGQGKTCALLGLLMALCGRSGMDWPEVALQEGEDEGWVKVDLTGGEDGLPAGFTLELYLTRKRGGQIVEKFRVVAEDGSEAKEPRALLKTLYKLRAFDPLEFERLDRKGKRAMLMSLLGLDFAKQDAEHKRLFDERTDVNRDGKKLKARWEAMPVHKGATEPLKEVVVADLLDELERRRKINLQNAVERAGLAARSDALILVEDQAVKLKDEIARLTRQLSEIKAEVVWRKNALETQRCQVAELQNEDEESIRQQIADAETVNRKVRENAERAKLNDELDVLRDQSIRLNEAMEKIIQDKQAALEEAAWPVQGLSVDADGVLYQGLPIEQAPRSVRLLTCVKIGLGLNPKLRLFVCQDGNDLDLESLAELQKILEENDSQMILEMVTRGPEDEGRCAVVVENGKSKARKAKDNA